ncbi:TPA: PepSY domain-containing protein [Enterococcus faecium]|nr:PepSY domain-containing protein [Neobacillus mesonae]HDT7699225.1 PepSY domain-containing protein [Enterococcus faecium]
MKMKKWGLYGGLAVILLIAIGLYFFQPWNRSDILSAEAVSESVLQQYPGGRIEQSDLQGGEYRLRLVTETGDYDLKVDAESGSIITIERMTQAETSRPELQSRDKIKKAVLADTPGDLSYLELIPDSSGQQQYRAEVKTKDGVVELSIDPYSGEVLSRTEMQAEEPQTDNEQPTGEGAIRLLSEKDAVDIALAEVNGELEDVELRARESDTPYFLVEIEDVNGEEFIVQVHAITGIVQSVMPEDDYDDEDDENE